MKFDVTDSEKAEVERLKAAIDAAFNEQSRIIATMKKRSPLSDADKAAFKDEYIVAMKRVGELSQKLADLWGVSGDPAHVEAKRKEAKRRRASAPLTRTGYASAAPWCSISRSSSRSRLISAAMRL